MGHTNSLNGFVNIEQYLACNISHNEINICVHLLVSALHGLRLGSGCDEIGEQICCDYGLSRLPFVRGLRAIYMCLM